jgi:peptide deformylase
MALQIVHFNDPVLRKKGARVVQFNADLRAFADEMVATMRAAAGIGLAAQQVGRALQLCVVDLRELQNDFSWEFNGAKPPLELFMPMVVVNPEVIPVPQPELVYEEGCLSFPGIRGDVTRPDEITVKFQDGHGTPHTLRCNGLLSRCLQHEADHLNGVLFIDRMEAGTLARLDSDLKALKKRTREAAKS